MLQLWQKVHTLFQREAPVFYMIFPPADYPPIGNLLT